MKIAQVAPPWLALPPAKHGGTELIVSVLTEQLKAMGYDVTLFASADSRTAAKLEPTFETGLGVGMMASTEHELEHMQAVARRAGQFDVIHVHTVIQASVAASFGCPVFMTLHEPPSPLLGQLDRKVRLVPPSAFYARAARHLALTRYIHHGIDLAKYPVRADKDDFLLFMGRLVPEKGLHLAIAAARAAGMPLVAVAVRSGFERERAYFDRVIAPVLASDVTITDQVDFATKVDLLGRARSLLFPIDWDEPFGLVAVEAMACGTPVLGTHRATVPELVMPGVTGLLFPVQGFASGVGRSLRRGALGEITPAACREHVACLFCSRLMAARYAAAYVTAVRSQHSRPAPRHVADVPDQLRRAPSRRR